MCKWPSRIKVIHFVVVFSIQSAAMSGSSTSSQFELDTYRAVDNHGKETMILRKAHELLRQEMMDRHWDSHDDLPSLAPHSHTSHPHHSGAARPRLSALSGLPGVLRHCYRGTLLYLLQQIASGVSDSDADRRLRRHTSPICFPTEVSHLISQCVTVTVHMHAICMHKIMS